MTGRDGRGRPARWARAVGWLLLLLSSLSLVTWRQTRGLAAERAVRELQTESARADAERVELTRRIDYLRSRSRIVQVSSARLGMHLPQDDEIVFLPVSAPVGDTMARAAR